jgi:hypothetical protein
MAGNSACFSKGKAGIAALDDGLLLRVFSHLSQRQL